MTHMFFTGWDSLLRTLVVGVASYAMLVLFLRVSGKRTLSKLNAFDFVVTVALGSTLATGLLAKDVAVADTVTAFGLLIGLQFLVTWSSVRLRWIRGAVTGEPHLLARRGELLPEVMRKTRIAESEIHAALRSAGVGALEEAEAVVLETDGSISVVRRGSGTSSLAGVRGIGHD